MDVQTLNGREARVLENHAFQARDANGPWMARFAPEWKAHLTHEIDTWMYQHERSECEHLEIAIFKCEMQTGHGWPVLLLNEDAPAGRGGPARAPEPGQGRRSDDDQGENMDPDPVLYHVCRLGKLYSAHGSAGE